jgi:hypothetical protein
MPRTPIYPEVEEFIAVNKHIKLETIQTDNTPENKRSKSTKKKR